MMNEKTEKQPLDLATVRERLAKKQGRQYWRSLEEAADTEEFREFMGREFPRYASEMRDPASRRNFLKLMGASLALAGLSGCQFGLRPQQEQAVPYVRLPENLIPGLPLYFATTMPHHGYGLGLIVESHEGRPTKVEGNLNHPASLGSTDTLAQASVLQMYDPNRSQFVLEAGAQSTWQSFVDAIGPAVQQTGNGAGLRILTETITAPALIGQINDLLEQFPEARWDQYEPVNRDTARAGAELAFGDVVDSVYNFAEASVILSLDEDFLNPADIGGVRYARDFSNGRRVREGATTMNRLYVAESSVTITGSMADHRWPLRPSQVETLARAVAQRLGVADVAGGDTLPEGFEAAWVDGLVSDLQANQGASLVVAGRYQPPVVHALAHAINDALGNVGTTVTYIEPVEVNTAQQTEALATLVDEMNGGQVQVLLMIGGNPVYKSPADLDFEAALGNVPLSVHYSLYNDETAAVSTWHVPAAHYLEVWGDARAFDGTASIIQPLIAPLYGNRSPSQFVAALQGNGNVSDLELVQSFWQEESDTDNFATFWQTALHEGVVPDTTAPAADVTLQTGFAAEGGIVAPAGLEVTFRPDPSVWDGEFSNNGWMQELPRPMTKLVWDNPAYISPTTAQSRGLSNGDLVTLSIAGLSGEFPVWVLPGQPNETVTLHLGYGRTRAGDVGNGVGFNTYAIRSSANPWFISGVEMAATGSRYNLVSTQEHFVLEDTTAQQLDPTVVGGLDRTNLIRTATFTEFQERPDFVYELGHVPKYSLYPPFDYTTNNPYSWGMVIDLNTCIGCNACTVACQAENNIPIVGKAEVEMSREMHWIRVDRYYVGDIDNPAAYHAPIPCMQCEKAPCEVVCPVAATIHDGEGLNNMVYNRCVGTKYCSNNCPYKVRRFNFLQYVDEETPVIQLQRNPNVTVRARGVMEKCTYCVQRINIGRIEAKKENRVMQDGEVLTACQQVCPTQAIVFGNINDANSQVSQLKAQPHNYGMLEELNIRPRTTYLARISNPNPDLETE